MAKVDQRGRQALSAESPVAAGGSATPPVCRTGSASRCGDQVGLLGKKRFRSDCCDGVRLALKGDQNRQSDTTWTALPADIAQHASGKRAGRGRATNGR